MLGQAVSFGFLYVCQLCVALLNSTCEQARPISILSRDVCPCDCAQLCTFCGACKIMRDPVASVNVCELVFGVRAIYFPPPLRNRHFHAAPLKSEHTCRHRTHVDTHAFTHTSAHRQANYHACTRTHTQHLTHGHTHKCTNANYSA